MKTLAQFIKEGKSAREDLELMINDWTRAIEYDKKTPKDIDKKDFIVTAKLCSFLDPNVKKITNGRTRYLYAEFKDNKLSQLAVIDNYNKEAAVWDLEAGYKEIDGDEYKNTFGYLASGSNKDIDMRIWKDTKHIITNNLMPY